MNVKLLFGTMLATVALSGVAIAPSFACPLSGDYKFSEGKRPLPMWVGAVALTAIAGSAVANEMTKNHRPTSQ